MEGGDRQRAGTGLGLAICRGFVEALGGTIAVANRPDRSGAIFMIICRRLSVRSAPADIGQRGRGMSDGVPILVIDDEPPIRRLLRTSLGAHGFQVLEAATGEGALGRGGARNPTSSCSISACRTWTAARSSAGCGLRLQAAGDRGVEPRR